MGFFEQIAVILQRYYPYFLDGVKNTLIIAAMSVVLGVVFGGLRWPISNSCAVLR